MYLVQLKAGISNLYDQIICNSGANRPADKKTSVIVAEEDFSRLKGNNWIFSANLKNMHNQMFSQQEKERLPFLGNLRNLRDSHAALAVGSSETKAGEPSSVTGIISECESALTFLNRDLGILSASISREKVRPDFSDAILDELRLIYMVWRVGAWEGAGGMLDLENGDEV
ncbi:hypothetical protein POTOM_043832 [Populus tomentosa]|uniref:Uncharacterized protein n=1 Tax=Populus tomentosa TaxID=118781 RepID=A0A8X7YKJ5_POPTO|nr:hypothetical protein POTOM_043832 [Populus tomentosa]